jgi:hypothetical protein
MNTFRLDKSVEPRPETSPRLPEGDRPYVRERDRTGCSENHRNPNRPKKDDSHVY